MSYRQRPHVEATPLLAAFGFANRLPILDLDPETDMRNPRFALLPRLNAVSDLQAFDSLSALAAHVDKQRFGQGFQLVQIDGLRQQAFEASGQTLHLSRGRDRGVQIWTTRLDGELDRSLGYAWLAGEGREALQRALSAAGQKAAA